MGGRNWRSQVMIARKSLPETKLFYLTLAGFLVLLIFFGRILTADAFWLCDLWRNAS